MRFLQTKYLWQSEQPWLLNKIFADEKIVFKKNVFFHEKKIFN